MRSLIGVALVVGCGRIGFDALPGGPNSDSGGGDRGPVMTVSFGETGTATYANVTFDNSLDQSNPTLNFGVSTILLCSPTQVALLRFDLAVLPASTVVVGAQLDIDTGSLTMPPNTTTLWWVTEAWFEGVQDGAPGISNWTQRTPLLNWSVPGGARDPTPLATFDPAAPGTRYTITFGAAGISAIQNWIANPLPNGGFAFDTPSGGWYFEPKQSGVPAKRPLLTLTIQ